MNRTYTIIDIAEFASSNYNAIIYLQQRHLLRNNLICPRCGQIQVLSEYNRNVNLGYILRCPNRNCRSTHSLCSGTYFENLHFPILKYIYLFYYWASRTPITVVREHLGIELPTLIDHYNYCRDICSWRLLQQPIQLGGPNIVVQIDESLFVKAKYNVGHALYRPQRWVFGLYDTSTKQGYITFVQQRDENTLLPIIQQVVLPGTIIHSDQWAAYNGILRLPHPQPYRHLTVNHSVNFVDPITGSLEPTQIMWKACGLEPRRGSST